MAGHCNIDEISPNTKVFGIFGKLKKSMYTQWDSDPFTCTGTKILTLNYLEN